MKANDQGGDLSLMWYVHWRQDGKTLKKYGKLAHIHVLDARREALEALRLEWQLKLDASQVEPVLDLLKKHLLAIKEERNWRWKTFQTNFNKVETFEAWLGKRRVSRDTLTAFFRFLRVERHPITHNRYLTEFYAYFKAIGQLQHWPEGLKIIPKAKRQSKPAKWLQRHELKLLETVIRERDPELWLAVQCMGNLALRPGELRMLKAENVYLDEKAVQVPGKVAKTGVERWARIPNHFVKDMQVFRQLQPGEYLFRRKGHPEMPMSKNYFSKNIRKIMDDLGFGPDYKPCYSFRHTMAMKGLRDGVPVDQMQRQYGHASLDQFISYTRQFGVHDLNDFGDKFQGL